MNTQVKDIQIRIEDGLNKVEERLPKLPAAAFRLQRKVGSRAVCGMVGAVEAMRVSSSTAAKAASTAAKTVTGTTRWAAKETAGTMSTAAKTIVGQTRAQVEIVGDTVASEARGLMTSARSTTQDVVDETTELLDTAATEVDTTTPTGAYNSWTKSDLYDRAQELDIDGRSSMSKNELIVALRAKV